MYIDTHAHLTFPEFEIDRPEVIERAKAARVEAIVNIALDDDSIKKSLQLSKDYPDFIFTGAGLHPHEASEWNDSTYQKFTALAKEHKLIAIGETGLDYHYKLSPVDQQKKVFRAFLEMAQELDLPAVIHSREAARDTINIIREENKGKLKGVLHCFAGDPELQKAALELGLHISFTNNITYPKADIIRTAAKEIPLDRIMIETDCPFLSPQAFRGQRNEPAYVIKVAEKIAEVKGLTVEAVAFATTENAKRLFGL
ncbi:MAG: TatD family hydrolase [Candidatus Margulisbacteria bacterium]|nr:TatD family hydrolase [Candidatus Margulisiibacteriota bacterium]